MNTKNKIEKEIDGELYIQDPFSFSPFSSLAYIENDIDSIDQIIHYSPLTLRCYYNKKGIWVTYHDISIKQSHPSYNATLNRKIPRYMNDVFAEALDFKYDDESAYTSVKMMGFIYLNTFVDKWILKDETIRKPYFSKFIDEFNISRYPQYKDRHGNIICEDIIKAINLAGFKWYNLFINQIKKQTEVSNILSSFISKDVSDYVLNDYLTLGNKYIIVNKIDESNLNTSVYKWKCKFYYYDLIDKKDTFILTDLVDENPSELGFPLYYSNTKKYYRADILFGTFDKEEHILFEIHDVVKIINLKIAEYQTILYGVY